MTNKHKHRGQVALIMVLVMTIVSAIVISFAGRATVETRVQNMMTNSSKAFLTAQSGIENALQKKIDMNETLDEERSYNVVLSDDGKELILSNEVSPGTSIEVALEGGIGLTGLKIYWSSAESTNSALYISMVGDDSIKDYAYDTTGEKGFTKALIGGTLNGVEFEHTTAEIPVTGAEKIARITVFGSNTLLGVEPVGGTFPAQTLKIRSSSTVGQGDKKAAYGLQYEEAKFNKVPEVFDYAVFSYGSVAQ